MAQTQVVTLSQVLNSASALLGETGGTPTAELSNRTIFANECKKMLSNMRNWNFEKKTGTFNITSTNSFTLPADFKNENAMDSVKVTDANGNSQYYSVATEEQWDYAKVNSMDDHIYYVEGDTVNGFTLYVNLPTPIVAVTTGITYRYFSTESDFVNLTDTTRIPAVEVLSRYVTAKVLYGYREQGQYQLAMNEFNAALEDLTSTDYKNPPHSVQKALTFKESTGQNYPFKSYF